MNRAVVLAKKTALTSEHNFKVGAVVVRGGKVLKAESNRVKTDPIRTYDKTKIDKLHAEMAVLRSCNTKGATLVVVRIDRRDNSLTMAKPCPDCMRLIRAAGIKKIIYSDFEGNLVKERA